MSAAKPSNPNAEETTALQTHLFTKAMMTSKDSSYNFFFYFLSHVNSVQSTDKFQTLKRKSPLKRIRIETYVTKIIAFKNYILSTLLPPVLYSFTQKRDSQHHRITLSVYPPHSDNYLQSGLNTNHNSQEPAAFPYIWPKQHRCQLAEITKGILPTSGYSVHKSLPWLTSAVSTLTCPAFVLWQHSPCQSSSAGSCSRLAADILNAM